MGMLDAKALGKMVATDGGYLPLAPSLDLLLLRLILFGVAILGSGDGSESPGAG
jgi:hypothetical protein